MLTLLCLKEKKISFPRIDAKTIMKLIDDVYKCNGWIDENHFQGLLP